MYNFNLIAGEYGIMEKCPICGHENVERHYENLDGQDYVFYPCPGCVIFMYKRGPLLVDKNKYAQYLSANKKRLQTPEDFFFIGIKEDFDKIKKEHSHAIWVNDEDVKKWNPN